MCELIGIYMLYLTFNIYNSKNIELYRDDELAVFKNLSGTAPEIIKKSITIFV